jgi:hypothetical protein
MNEDYARFFLILLLGFRLVAIFISSLPGFLIGDVVDLFLIVIFGGFYLYMVWGVYHKKPGAYLLAFIFGILGMVLGLLTGGIFFLLGTSIIDLPTAILGYKLKTNVS